MLKTKTFVESIGISVYWIGLDLFLCAGSYMFY